MGSLMPLIIDMVPLAPKLVIQHLEEVSIMSVFGRRNQPVRKIRHRSTTEDLQRRAKAKREAAIELEIQSLMKSDPEIKLQIVVAYLDKELRPSDPDVKGKRDLQGQLFALADFRALIC